MIKNIFLIALVLLFAGVQTWADGIVSPIGLALTGGSSDIEFPGTKSDVMGLRLALLSSNNENVYGIDVGLIQNGTNNNFVGIGVAAVMNSAKHVFVTGLRVGGFGNVDGSLNGFGLDIGGFGNGATAEGYFVGGQIALLANRDMGHLYGFQLGLQNRVKTIVGVQIGLYNEAENLHGIQIGAWNVNKSGPIKGFPVVNIGF